MQRNRLLTNLNTFFDLLVENRESAQFLPGAKKRKANDEDYVSYMQAFIYS